MPPLTGNAVGTSEHMSVNDDTAANTGTEDHAEHHRYAGRRTISRLGERKAIRIVRQPNGATQQRLQITPQGLPDQSG